MTLLPHPLLYSLEIQENFEVVEESLNAALSIGGEYISSGGSHEFTLKIGESEAAFNIPAPPFTKKAVGGIATINTFVGKGWEIFLISGGNFFQLYLRAPEAVKAEISVKTSYVQWFE